MTYNSSDDIQAMQNELLEIRGEIERRESEVVRLQNRQYADQSEIAVMEVPKLKAEMAANNEKIAHLEERKRYFETEQKILDAKMKELRRKQCDRRIFTRGGMLEAFLIEPLLLTDDVVHDFLQTVFRMPEVDSLLQELIDHARTLEDDDSENGVEGGEE